MIILSNQQKRLCLLVIKQKRMVREFTQYFEFYFAGSEYILFPRFCLEYGFPSCHQNVAYWHQAYGACGRYNICCLYGRCPSRYFHDWFLFHLVVWAHNDSLSGIRRPSYYCPNYLDWLENAGLPEIIRAKYYYLVHHHSCILLRSAAFPISREMASILY